MCRGGNKELAFGEGCGGQCKGHWVSLLSMGVFVVIGWLSGHWCAEGMFDSSSMLWMLANKASKLMCSGGVRSHRVIVVGGFVSRCVCWVGHLQSFMVGICLALGNITAGSM